ncbi:recombinase family protein [Nocardia takedensis]|uniref:recombinase family protein n=1 Tax=Nocardia takedensis TaxID=259390 RepID=UPI003571443D
MSTRRGRGRPPSVHDSVVHRIMTMRHDGVGYRGICAVLNQEGVPTPAGSRHWYPSHISRLLYTRNVADRFGPPPEPAATTGMSAGAQRKRRTAL